MSPPPCRAGSWGFEAPDPQDLCGLYAAWKLGLADVRSNDFDVLVREVGVDHAVNLPAMLSGRGHDLLFGLSSHHTLAIGEEADFGAVNLFRHLALLSAARLYVF